MCSWVKYRQVARLSGSLSASFSFFFLFFWHLHAFLHLCKKPPVLLRHERLVSSAANLPVTSLRGAHTQPLIANSCHLAKQYFLWRNNADGFLEKKRGEKLQRDAKQWCEWVLFKHAAFFVVCLFSFTYHVNKHCWAFKHPLLPC